MISLSTFILIVTLTCVKYPDVTKAYVVSSFQGNDVEGQIITQSDGESGEACPPLAYKCVTDVECVMGQCVCPTGTHGEGTLACMPSDSYLTMVLADPKVITYKGTSAHLCLPCRILITEIVSEHYMGRKGGTCGIKVHVLNHQVGDGYFVLGIDLEVTISDNAKPKATAQFSLRIYGYGSNRTFEYKEQGKAQTPGPYRPWSKPRSLRYMDAMIRSRYDLDNNLAIVDIGECGVTTVFRAQVKYTKQMPGLIVAVDKNRPVSFPQDNNPLSGSPFDEDGPDLMHKKKLLKLNKVQTLLYDALTQDTAQDFGALAISCNVASREFKSLCRSPMQRAFALRICSFFFTNSTISCCLKADEFGETNGSLFGMCCLAMCIDDYFLCTAIKEELKIYNCGAPQGLHNLDCQLIKYAREDMFSSHILE